MTKSRRPTRNWLAQREQRRLLLVVATFALVLFLMNEARKPANWTWLWGGAGNVRPIAAGDDAGDREINTVIHEPDEPKDGAKLVVTPTDDKKSGPADQQPEPEPSARVEYFPGVRTDLLGDVRDRTTSHYPSDPESSEQMLWFNLLDLLNRSNEEALHQSNPVDVTFAQLFRQPKTNRGRLVHFKGYVKRAVWWKAIGNDAGIEGYWQLWVAFNGQTIVVYALELPEGFQTGDDLNEPIDVVGFFYKLWAHPFAIENKQGEMVPAHDLNVAPIVLARTVGWAPPQTAEAAKPIAAWIWFAGVAACVVFAVVFTYWVWRRSFDSGAEAKVRRRDVSMAPLASEHIASVSESLHELERSDTAGAPSSTSSGTD